MSAIEQYKPTNRKRIEKFHVLYPFLFNSRSEYHSPQTNITAAVYNIQFSADMILLIHIPFLMRI